MRGPELHAASLLVLGLTCALPAAAQEAPQPAPPPPSAATTSETVRPPAEAPQPAAPAPDQTPPPAAPAADAPVRTLPPGPNPYVPAHTPPWRVPGAEHRRITREELKRLRAQLAAERAQLNARVAERRQRARPPIRHGDATARVSLGLEVSAIARPDDGFARFDAGHTSARYGLFAGYDVLRLPARLALVAELGAGFESEDAPQLLGSSRGGSLDSQTAQAAIALRWDALPFLSPQLRAAGGASFFQLSLDADSQGAPGYETLHATSGFGSLGAGVQLHTPPRTFETDGGQLASFGFGLLIEAGYALRGALQVEPRTRAADGAIPVVDASLGKLSLSGGYLRTALVFRF